MTIIDFDYELARVGYALDMCHILTRDHCQVVIVEWDHRYSNTPEGKEETYPIVGFILLENSNIVPTTWTKEGKFSIDCDIPEHPFDLVYLELLDEND